MSPLLTLGGLVALIPALALANGHLETARQLAQAGSPAAAVPEYEAALEDSPRDPQLWMELGNARLQAGQARSAAKAFQKAMSLDPGDDKAIRGLALSLEASGETSHAMLEWRHYAQVSPAGKSEAEKHISALMNGTPLGSSAAATTAVPTQDKASAPSGEKAASTGTADASAPEPSAAQAPPVKEGRNGAKQPAADKDAGFQKGLELYRSGKKDAALEEFRKVLKKRPGHSGAYYFAGIIRNEKNDPDKARFNLTRAKDPFYRPRALYWLARIDEKAGKKAAAAAGYRKALELGLDPETAAEARKHLEATGGAGAPAKGKEKAAPKAKVKEPAHAAKPSEVQPEAAEKAPPALPDTLRKLYSWNAPWVPFPSVPEGDDAGKEFADAGEKRKLKKGDDALEVLRQLQVRHPNTPAAAAALLGTAVIQYDMGLLDNSVATSQAFLKDNPKSDLAGQAQFLVALSLLRNGKDKDALDALEKLGPRTTGFPSEAQRLSALAQAQSVSGKRTDAASTLRAAFGMEANPELKRGLALRAYREYQAIRAGGQALPLVQEALKGCDKSDVCQRLSVAKADLVFQAPGGKGALEDYRKIVSTWPDSKDADWARYQIGNCLMQQGHSDQAAAAWKEAAQSTSYWGQQAKFRLEELSWRSGSR
jgi:tetratricopeptide (TPR) repeat protein